VVMPSSATARPTFGDRPGTPEALWAAAGLRAGSGFRAADLVLPQGLRLVLVAAHPDDESLGAAGLAVRVARAGGRTDLVVATDGEASHPHSPSHTPEQLRDRRAQEIAVAANLLGCGSLLRLGIPDGSVADHQDRLERALDDLLAHPLANPLPNPLAKPDVDAEQVWLVAPWRQDGHPDHEAAGRAAAAVAARLGIRLLEYPIWAWEWADSESGVLPADQLVGLELDAAERLAKQRAIAAHRSQLEPLSDRPGDEPVLPGHVLAHFERDVEVFLDTAPAGPVAGPLEASAGSLPQGYFTEIYAAATDGAPWGLDRGWYERRKRSLLLAALTRPRYRVVVEPGCGIGLLTVELAARADQVLAFDVAAQAVRLTSERVAAQAPSGLGEVLVRHGSLPSALLDVQGPVDLIVLSEVGYYLSASDWREVVQRCTAMLEPGGELVACHWRHPAAGYPATADDVHGALHQACGLTHLAAHAEDDFLLDVFATSPAQSVARRQGLVG